MTYNMEQTETLTKELEEAKKELIRVDKEYHKLEFHRKHLHEIIKDRMMRLNGIRKGSLAPVFITLYKREDGSILERDSREFNKVSEAVESFDFSQHDYETMGISCYYPEDDFSARYSMDMNKLPQVIAEGKVVLISQNAYWTEGDNYESGVLTSPTYFYALQVFHQSIYTTGDKHHIFLERVNPILGSEETKLRKKYGEDVKFFKFVTGS